MRKFIYSVVCSIALLSFTLLPNTAKAEGYSVWVFWCGETHTWYDDAEDQEWDIWDDLLYDILEYEYCGGRPR